MHLVNGGDLEIKKYYASVKLNESYILDNLPP